MADNQSDSADTPLMRQYLEVKERYADCIVFFRLGDFYEMFFDDAVVVARALDLTLTSRDKGKENPIPMCGVPHHSSAYYLAKLVERGFKVAICEQVEDPKVARGIVRRDVVRVVSPGALTDEEQLDPKRSNYLCALLVEGERVGLAYLDISTGEFAATELAFGDLESELSRIEPREILHDGGDFHALATRVPAMFASLAPHLIVLDEKTARTQLRQQLGADVAAGFTPLALRAAAEVVAYAQTTQPIGKLPLTHLQAYVPGEHLLIDDSSRAQLELFRTLMSGERRGSLLGVIDQTVTSMGGRLMRRWLAAPLCGRSAITRRQDAVQYLVEESALRAELRRLMASVYDLERLAGRVSLGVATPRDLAALGRSLAQVPGLAAALRANVAAEKLPALLALSSDLCEDVATEITRTLTDDPPAQWKEGGFLRAGFSAEFDELVELAQGGKDRIAEIETREQKRTGIGSLKIRYNRVFGYYLEITRANLERVPSDYVRKQTLANAERFITPELADYEAKILNADERRIVLEMEALDALRASTAKQAGRILALAERVAQLDVLASLAEVAHASSYVRPVIDDSFVTEIAEGRHPVVEALVAQGKFVPNDVTLDVGAAQLLIVTGPNMAGKSTVMRQVALITILGQMGSFVPAARARLGICDRLFSRVGAADNVSRGESTFMVEMRETANILAHATRRSLVILDEIGRGTSTFDGLAIAWAVAEHLHDRVGCRAMFATHYHELVELAESCARVRNFSTAVREHNGDVVFLHRLVAGAASRSYGVAVAKLAGLEPSVVARASEVMRKLESGSHLTDRLAATPLAAPLTTPIESRRAVKSAVVEALANADLDGMAPREAQAFLYELRHLAEKEQSKSTGAAKTRDVTA